MSKTRESDLLARFFRTKAGELRAQSNGVLAPHLGLRGSHREQLCRDFLVDFLPKRYSVGRGMVFDSIGHLSRECDVVIWDDQNYPRLNEKGHTLFFVNSVRSVIEIKSAWSASEWGDTLSKTQSMRRLVTGPRGLIGLSDRLDRLEHQVAALRQGATFEGMIVSGPAPAVSAIFLEGGAHCTLSTIRDSLGEPDDQLPDVTLLVEPGLLIEKWAIEEEERVAGWVGIRNVGPDALMAFMLRLLEVVNERSSRVEDAMMFPEALDLQLDMPPAEGFAYPSSRMPSRSTPVFSKPA